MPTHAENALEASQQRIGKTNPPSEWIQIDQDRIDGFADATLDDQFIHVDPERAKTTPWGTTIAHGFLTLSLIPHLSGMVSGTSGKGVLMGVNYGLDKVRFISPVPVGSRVRAVSELLETKLVDPNTLQQKSLITIEIEGGNKPACVAEMIGRTYFS